MHKISVNIRELLHMLSFVSLIKSFFKGSSKADKIYKVIFIGVLSCITVKIGKMVYKLYKDGCIREIEKTADEDDPINEPIEGCVYNDKYSENG